MKVSEKLKKEKVDICCSAGASNSQPTGQNVACNIVFCGLCKNFVRQCKRLVLEFSLQKIKII